MDLEQVFSLLRTFSYYLPHAFGIVLGVAFTVWMVFFFKKKRKQAKEDAEIDAAEAGEEARPQKAYRSASRFRLRRNLNRALRMLKSNIYGRNYRYQIPWFLLVGETNAGKTEALHHTEITLPLGAPEESLEGSREGWKWWFFDQGIVIDVDGDYVLRTDNRPTDHKGWNHLLSLLQSNRPQRPIDGVVLAIPATDLMGPPETVNDRVIKVGEKAAALFDKLATAQKILGMRFPVYMMITQCDQIRGFKSFCGELPKGLQQDMFGWSNPYTLDAAFTTQWIDEAFKNIYTDLYQTQIEVIVDGIQVQDTDSFYMFPKEFQSMLEPIRTYANHIFKQSVYHEAFYFRGLYFCGDSSLEGISQVGAGQGEQTVEHLFPETEYAASKVQQGGNRPKKILFLKDLFEKKIFPEFRLARPTARIFLWRSRLTWALRSCIAGVALIWALGLWWGYSNLEEEKVTLVPLLKDISTQLTELKVRGPEEDTAFNKMALNLLKGMTDINTSSLTSVFIPSSWAGNLDDNIRKSMVLAYDKIILKSLYFELEEKVKTTLEQDEESGDSQLGDPININQFKVKELQEIQRLKKVVNDLDKLWKNIELYNGLQNTKDLSQLGQVVKFLFGFDLPTDFYKNAAYYHNALKDVEYRLYDPTIARFLVTTPRVRGLSQELYIRLFEENPMLAKLEDFATGLEDLMEQDLTAGGANAEQTFHNMLNQIEEMEALLARPQFAWMAEPKFNLGPVYNDILDSVETSAFMGGELRREIETAGEEGFRDLVFQLRGQETSFAGKVLATEGNRIQMKLGSGVLELKRALKSFLEHKFMAPLARQSELVSDLTPNDRLLWKKEQLQEAIVLNKDFNSFIKQDWPSFPEEMKPLVRQAALRKLETNMNEFIAQSQQVKQVRDQFAFTRKEEDLAAEIRNFKKTAPILAELMDVFFDLDFSDSSWTLFDMVSTHAFYLLQTIDQLSENEALYEFRDGNFTWWDGLTPASIEAYNVLDKKELTYYLTIQRERIKHLAREYAEPLVNFLVNRTIKRGKNEDRLLTKWHRIIVALDQYEAKRTRSTLTLLERFILMEMDTIEPQNCFKKITLEDLRAPVRDYFGEKLHNLRTELSKQCRALAKDEVYQRYSVVETFFNQKLANRFPFAPISDQPILEEADPDNIRKFYHLLDRYLDSGLDLLEKSTKFGLSRDNALEFIYIMEEARPFFAPFLGAEPPTGPAYLLDVDFRVNSKTESGANQIIDWQMETKGVTRKIHQKKKEPLRWDYGDPILLTFRWAKNSPDVPVTAGDWQGALVDRRTVEFEYANGWSLIQLLYRHQAQTEDFGALGDPKPNTLRFLVNTVERDDERLKKEVYFPETKQAKFFVRVVVKSPKDKERILLPQLPQKAPGLKEEVRS